MKVANVIPRSFDKTIKSSIDCEDAANLNDGNSTPNDSVSKGKSAREVVAPLAHMSYSDQLDHKKISLSQVLKKLVRAFIHYNLLL